MELDEGLYLPDCETNFVRVLPELSLLFCNVLNTTFGPMLAFISFYLIATCMDCAVELERARARSPGLKIESGLYRYVLAVTTRAQETTARFSSTVRWFLTTSITMYRVPLMKPRHSAYKEK